MRYYPQPRYFKTRHWADLWRSNLADLKSIQSLSESSGFVIIDAEGRGDRGDLVSEIGIALLCPVDSQQQHQSVPLRTLEGVQGFAPTYTHLIRVKDGEYGKAHREPFMADVPGDNGYVHLVDDADVEDTLLAILGQFRSLVNKRIKQKMSGVREKTANLILVGFDLSFELRLISSSHSSITQSFSPWVDIQEIAYDVSANAKLNERPCLRDCLLAFGFKENTRAVISPETKHSAGNDVMRIAAILVNLLLHPPESKLDVPRRSQRKRQQKATVLKYRRLPFFRQARPHPVEHYPFTAMIQLFGLDIPDKSPHEFLRMFSSFHPTAVGTLPPWKTSAGAWVCLASLEELNRFVQEMDGVQSELYGGTWKATSYYDPSTTPAKTAAELKECLAATDAMSAAERKKTRKLREEECDADLFSGVAAMYNEDDEE